MSTHHQPVRFSLLFCCILLTCGIGLVAQHQAAHAASASLPPGYSLSVTESASTMTYGGSFPNFQAQLTVPTGENPLRNPALFNFMIDSQDYAPDSSAQSGGTYTFTLRGASLPGTPPLPAGPHAVVASYFSIPLNQTLDSAPITLTVQKLTPILDCEVHFLPTFAANASVTFTLSAQNGPAVDWPDATYTMTFLGTQTYTDNHLTADSSGTVTAAAPPVPGRYKFQCTFNGTANFNAASVQGSSTVVVSAGHQPAIKLYTNPTTITGGTSATLDIVVSGASGLPTPTGQFNLSLGNLFTKSLTLEPNGSAKVQINFPQGLPSNTLWVDYFGDTVYASTNASFSLTNPPIPGGSNPSNPTPTPKPGSTAVATSSPASGSTPPSSGTTTTNGGTTTSGSHPTDPASNQGSLALWIVLIAFLVLVAGGSGVFIVLRKRARAASMAATAPFPRGWDAWGNNEEDGWPR